MVSELSKELTRVWEARRVEAARVNLGMEAQRLVSAGYSEAQIIALVRAALVAVSFTEKEKS